MGQHFNASLTTYHLRDLTKAFHFSSSPVLSHEMEVMLPRLS